MTASYTIECCTINMKGGKLSSSVEYASCRTGEADVNLPTRLSEELDDGE